MTQSVTDALHDALRAEGKIPFSRFMELALYHPSGYYGKSVEIGGTGADFYTASQFPLFGFTLGKYIFDEWKRRSCPEHMQVVEIGAGQGEMAHNICEALQAYMPTVHIEYVIVEASVHLQTVQRRRLASLATSSMSLRWGLPNPDVDTVLIANEVLDALPVELLQRTRRSWMRGWVRADGENSFALDWQPASTWLCDLAEKWLPIPFDTRAELCVGLPEFFLACTNYGYRTAALFIDYGSVHDELRAGLRPQGTIRGYAKHQIVDPFYNPGACDITADVVWDRAIQAAMDAGWDHVVLHKQGKFLMDIGVTGILEQLWEASGGTLLQQQSHTGQFKQLVLPGGMGERFSVLECRRQG
jgi:NADH dehydrogenase [ubiquinone] 1 alpha subcomplex assembly factor 7